jgi:DNA-directed RNA polymerase specialized sigma24 family protein
MLEPMINWPIRTTISRMSARSTHHKIIDRLRNQLADKLELQHELDYATHEVERLTNTLEERSLECQKLRQQHSALEMVNSDFRHRVRLLELENREYKDY